MNDKRAKLAKQAARAIDALRRGWAVKIVGDRAAMTLRAIETAANMPARALLISSARAATLKLANQRAAGDISQPVMIAPPPRLDGGLAMAIADPLRDLLFPMKGPFAALPLPDIPAAAAAMELARHAGLLPAFLVCDDDADADTVTPAAIDCYADPGGLTIAARARLPVQMHEAAEIVAFRSVADASDHIALIVGHRDGSPPLVRLHSECLTGDVLGSLKCDCGPQLHEALGQMARANWGILLYLRQEGRGIGLINKLRAYGLQDQGFDTVDANIRLGFAVDARDFSVAAHMLRLLNVEYIRLLTNNPEKVARLEAENLTVVERLPLSIAANVHNANYLNTKRDRTGHKL